MSRTHLSVVLLVLFAFTTSRTLFAERQQMQFRPGGESSGAPVELSFEGAIHSPALDLAYESTDDAVALVRKALAAGKETIPQEIIPLWAPDDRSDIEVTLGDSQAVERSRAFARRVRSAHLHATIQYGEMTLVVVEQRIDEGRPLLSLFPIVRIEGRPYLSNRLADDPMYALLRTLLIRRFVPSAL
jgi:hypothetical protein